MTEDHIGVKIDGVIYVKLEDVKPMRARIEKLELALREIAALGYWDGDRAMSIAHKALETKDG